MERPIEADTECSIRNVCNVLIHHKWGSKREEECRSCTNLLVPKWMELARKLGVAELQIIEIDHGRPRTLFSETMHSVLVFWVAGYGRNATLSVLAESLISVDLQHLTDMLRYKFIQDGEVSSACTSGKAVKNVKFEIPDLDSCFTGRKQELKELHDTVQKSQSARGSYTLTVVSGLGGVGKTQLCRKYALTYGTEYNNNVIWINADNRVGIEEAFFRLADDDRVQTGSKTQQGRKSILTVKEEVYEKFSNTKLLIIFDNVNTWEVLKGILPSTSESNCKNLPFFLVTSQLNDKQIVSAKSSNHCQFFTLGGLLKEDATDLVRSHEFAGHFEDKEVDELVTLFSHKSNTGDNGVMLRCFTLALRQAIAYLKNQMESFESYSIREFIEGYQRNRRGFLESNDFYEKDPQMFYKNSLYTTWEGATGAIKASRAGRLAMKVLHLISILHPDDIPRDVFTPILNDFEGQRLEDAIELLEKYSLISTVNHRRFLFVHRLVQEVTQEKVKEQPDEFYKLMEDALPVLQKCKNLHIITAWNNICLMDATRLDSFIQNYYKCALYTSDQLTPLHLLVNLEYGNHIGAITEICKRIGKGINVADRHNITPLWIAAETGNAKAIKRLIQCGAHLSTPIQASVVDRKTNIIRNNMIGWTPMHIAAARGHTDCVKLLHESDKNLCKIHSKTGDTALSLAPKWIIEVLAKNDPYFTTLAKLESSKYDNPVLSQAETEDVRRRPYEFLKAAVGKRYSLSAVQTLLSAAGLKEDNIDQLNLHFLMSLACPQGNLELVKYFCEHFHARPDIPTNVEGWTCLHAAAQNGQLKIVNYFLENFPAATVVNVADIKNDAPIHTACFHGQLKIVKTLIEHGADYNACNVLGASPIICSLFSGPEIAEYMLEHVQGLKLFHEEQPSDKCAAFTKARLTVLHFAAAFNCKKVVELLLKRGFGVDDGIGESVTPLHVAVVLESFEVVPVLLEHGADIEARTNLAFVMRQVLDCIGNDCLGGNIPKPVKFFCWLSQNLVSKFVGQFCEVTPLSCLGMLEESCAKSMYELMSRFSRSEVDIAFEERQKPGFVYSWMFFSPYVYKYVKIAKEYILSKRRIDPTSEVHLRGDDILEMQRFMKVVNKDGF